MKLAILKNESEYDHLGWMEALDDKAGVSYDIINISKSDWLEKVQAKEYDLFLTRPPGISEVFKSLYDERVFIINKVLGKNIYPSLLEVQLYENKKFLSYWLRSNKIAHPFTYVFYFENEAKHFAKNYSFPLVAKTNIGAGGAGVIVLKNVEEANEYIKQAFSSEGIKRKGGFKLFHGNIFRKIYKVLTRKNFIKNRVKEYKNVTNQKQNDYVIFQEFINHNYEWRCVRIGDSYFAHKKIVGKDNKASGTLEKGYDNPPEYLLDFIRLITEKHNLKSVAIDLFESDKNFLVNEIQCFFGQSDSYQMLVDQKPGRYIYNKEWIFEEGMFNTKQSYDLRLEHAISTIKK